MCSVFTKLRVPGIVLAAAVLTACGSGDEYEGFDASVDSATPDKYLMFFNQQDGDLNASAYASAYYAAVDPDNVRSTLEDYIALHTLDGPDVVHVIFRDSKDLGYGRDMYMRSYPNTDCGGQTIAFYVRNFSVQIVDGFAYGPVNLDAAIDEDMQYHVGTNAIEFGRGRIGATETCSSEPMTRFFTFNPVQGGPDTRRIRVNLDDRGNKAMPQPCISCHGGRLRPLDRNGDFVASDADDPASQIGDVKAHLQAFEVDTFGFSDVAGYSRAEQENNLRKLNLAVYCSYPGSDALAACAAHGGGVPAQTDPGQWSGDFAREMLEGWYGGTLGASTGTFDDSYIPAGWVPSVGGPPAGADTLFTKVVGPNCFVCHGKQGSELGTDSNASGEGKDVDFSSWDKFISHADDIERLVFNEGRMPLGLLNFQNFWGDPEKAELLASFIAPYVTDPAGFSARRVDSNGEIIEPGERIIARAGPDRVTSPGATITLDASASLFAESYRWQIVSKPGGETATLSSPGSRRTSFTGSGDGEYVLRMTASSSKLSSRSDTLKVVVDSGLVTAPRALNFYTNISGILTANCTSCHSNGGSVPGIPVWWTDDLNQPFTVPPAGTPSLGLYEQFMTRVNEDYVENSLVLKKPSGNHHYGGLVGGAAGGFDTSLSVGSAGRATYDMFVNWIAEGAVCGGTADQCP
ncbi:MAG: hypothetical protein PVI70_15370 [Gammaproteobacteria bacterium]